MSGENPHLEKNLPILVDSHAHLDDPRFADDLDEVLARAEAAGIIHILTVGGHLESSRANVALAERYPQLFAAVGIHPHDAGNATDEALAELEEMARTHPKVVAIGETGLDFFYDLSPRDTQKKVFREQLRMARRLDLPVIIHDRDAHEEIYRILREEADGGSIRGVMHCFSGDREFARRCLQLGLYLSFAGPLTFPRNEELRAVAAEIPAERLLVETDCPYLAPQGHRGKRNEPALVRVTAEKVAELKGLSMDDISRIVCRNTATLLGIGEVAGPASPIVYTIRDSLYLNITNRCSNSCVFCAKFHDFTVKGHYLKLDHEPSVDEVMAAIGDPARYQEVVFCGYGEPLLRLDLVIEVARRLKQQGVKVRINSDGQANLVHGRNILPELAGLVDAMSISLNAHDAETYLQITRSPFGPAAFAAVQDFLREANRFIPSVTASVVTYPGVDVEAARRLVEELGVNFRVRQYQEAR
ncbi:MAG: YchF/TatD family DNA exonuclease [Desulfuromonadaceae bacterium]|nr:YchF/TatD family DNA exonuclease [Desulfuromonadaceae bacterium]